MEKILMVSDLSEHAETALQRAISIARAGRELHILHVVDGRYQGSLAETLCKLAEEQLNKQLQKHLRPEEIAKTQIYIVFGEPHTEILKLAHKLSAAYVILGMHRKQSLDLFAGTTLDRVSRYNPGISLLAKDTGGKPYTHILHLTDFSTAAERALTAAQRLAPEAKIVMAHIPIIPYMPYLTADEVNEYRKKTETSGIEKMQQQAETYLGKNSSARVEYIVKTGKPLDVIIQLAKDKRIDLIAVGKHNRSALSETLGGSISRLILSYPPCDVLTAKA